MGELFGDDSEKSRKLYTKKDVIKLIDEKLVPVWDCLDDFMREINEIHAGPKKTRLLKKSYSQKKHQVGGGDLE